MNSPDETNARRLDGNALGGPLADLFVPDLTAAVVTCVHCAGQAPLATYHVYPDAPALVVRCPSCTGVVLRCRSDPRGLTFEMSGIRLITVPVPRTHEP